MKISKNAELAIREFVEECKKKFGENLTSIVMFGSHARGNFRESSDIDFLVIVKDLPEKWKERKKLFEEAIRRISEKYEKYIEVIPLTEKEFISNLMHSNSLFITFFLGHKVLFDRNFFTPNFKNFAIALSKERYLYYEGGEKWEIKELAEKYLQNFG